MKNTKKLVLLTFVLLLASSFLISGCGKKQLMDQPAKDGKYHYQNDDLGFSLILPEEFIYYQTQRKQNNDFADIEFFVPSSDKEQGREVPGYAKPIVVRIYQADKYQEEGIFRKIGEKNSQIYALEFWQNTPLDWQEKWSENMENFIISNFEIK